MTTYVKTLILRSQHTHTGERRGGGGGGREERTRVERRTFRIIEVVTVYPCIADVVEFCVEDVCKLTGCEWAWYSSDEDCLPKLDGMGSVPNALLVRKLPWTNLYLKR